MKKITIAAIFGLSLYFPSVHAEQINFDLLTTQMMYELDQVSVSAAAAITVSEFCNPNKTESVGKKAGIKIVQMIQADPKTKEAALLYVKDSADRKVRALKQSNVGKSCQELSNLRSLVNLYNFDTQ